MSRPCSRALRTAAALLLSAALFGCQDSPRSTTTPEATPREASQAAPQPPHFAGRLDVELQAGLVGVGGSDAQTCAPTARRVCSSDGTRTYAPLEEPVAATLVRAHARLSPGHGDWTTTFRFDGASRRAVTSAASTAAGVGGVLLVMTPARQVLLVARPADVDREVIRLTQLSKPEAWRLVTILPGA